MGNEEENTLFSEPIEILDRSEQNTSKIITALNGHDSVNLQWVVESDDRSKVAVRSQSGSIRVKPGPKPSILLEVDYFVDYFDIGKREKYLTLQLQFLDDKATIASQLNLLARGDEVMGTGEAVLPETHRLWVRTGLNWAIYKLFEAQPQRTINVIDRFGNPFETDCDSAALEIARANEYNQRNQFPQIQYRIYRNILATDISRS